MFGDAVRLPRFVLGADDSWVQLDTGEALKQRIIDPTTGALTVENDRPVIEVLSLVANHLRSKLWLGDTSNLISQARLDHVTVASEDEAVRDMSPSKIMTATHGVFANEAGEVQQPSVEGSPSPLLAHKSAMGRHFDLQLDKSAEAP